MKERLRPSDYRFIAICAALLAGSVWYAAGNFYRAFPEASIDFRVNRTDAEQRARAFLGGQGYQIAGYRSGSSFSYDDDAKTFLERELGLEKANQLMGTRVRLWRWSFRWFRPQQKEEFRADITPTGDFVEFSHEIAEDAARPDISADQARAVAEDFLRTRAHRDPASLEFVETSSETRPHRVDRTLTWKERGFDVHDATYRISVGLLGNEVGGYSEYLKIPENWTRDYERLRSKNNEAQTFDLVAMVALLIALMVVLVGRVRRQDVRWRRAAAIGVIGMALSFLSSLNEFPLAEFGYPTTDAYSSFVFQKLLQALLSALGWGGALFVITAGAEAVYREAFPQKLSLGKVFSPRGLRTRHFFLGAILGVTLCGIFIAYQTFFYIVAYRFGAWSPADVPYSDLLNTKFPWAYVLIGGYLPAISEEFVFRMFAIPFLRKAVRWLPLAVVLAAFTWGFGHAGYAQQPFYIRGVEVGIGGVALGCIMLRWGILPTLVWHYSVDAMYSAMLLLRSHSLYFQLSGAASAGIFVLPIAAALVAYWRKGGFEPESGLFNRDEPKAPDVPLETAAPETAPAEAAYRPIPAAVRFAAIAIFAAGMLTTLIPARNDFGKSPVYKLTPEQARAASDAFLRTQGVDPAPYLHITYPESRWGGDDTLAAKYFLEHGPVSEASQLFERNRPLHVWATRYFKSLEKEEFLVTVQPETGRPLGYLHQIPEDRPGADLQPDAAREMAAAFAAAQGFDVSAMELKESDSDKKKARRDYTLVWEAGPGDARNLAEAHYRLAIGVDGDKVSALRTYWKLPEDFERSRNRQNLISILVLAATIGVGALAIVFGLWMLIRRIRQGLVPWRRALLWAIVPTAMTLVSLALSLHLTLYRGYQTSIPFETFAVTTSAILAIGVAFAFVMYTAATAFLLTFFPESFRSLALSQRRTMGLDALIGLLLAIGLWQISHQTAALLTQRLHALALLEVDTPTLIDLPSPAAAAVSAAVRSLFSQGAMLAILALVWLRLRKRWLLAPLLLLALASGVSSDARTAGEFALEYGIGLFTALCALLFCLWFARDNYLAYVVVLALAGLHPALVELIGSPNPPLALQGWVVTAVGIALVLWAIAPGLAARPRPKLS